MIHQVSQLTNGQSYCLPTGWSRHAIYLIFTRYGEHLHLRLDNLGAGINKHKEGAVRETIEVKQNKGNSKKEKNKKTKT